MTNADLVRAALTRCRHMQEGEPALLPLQLLERQLEYLLDLEEGRAVDRRHLGELTIGVVTAREIEPRDPEFAEVLYRVVELVERLRFS